jgi:hypothetical protein
MTVFFSWRKFEEESIADWKSGKFSYIYNGRPSRKAIWVFTQDSAYHPDKNITNDRILIAYNIPWNGKTVVELKENWIRYPGSRFLGETRHPDMVIVKDNEPGAYGIGADIRLRLLVKEIRIATRQEVADSLGLKPNEIDFRKQRW